MYLYVVHVITYWLSCLVFMTVNLYLDKDQDMVYRIKAEARSMHPPSARKVNTAIWVSIANQLISLPIALIIVPYCTSSDQSDVTSWEIIMTGVKIIFYAIIADQWFYWSHRIMHGRIPYQKIHSIQWTYPIAIGTMYVHPVEHVLCNLGSFLIGPLIWKSSIPLLGFWMAVATFNAVSAHCGIHFPLLSIEKHDLHHRYLNCNYGTSGISDSMYGTRRF